jgi:hypothetical protein
VKRARLEKMELLLNQEQVAIGLFDAKAQKLMEDAKELYAEAEVEAHANTTIKQQEDLNGRTITVGQRQWVVVEQEQELQEKEEVIGTLECGRTELSSREADLTTRDTTLEANQKRMGELCMSLLAYKLAADLQENNLAFRGKEL